MIRSSESLMAEDVTIRCRVRRSQYASNASFDEAQEMTCTMRNWEACRSHRQRPQRALSAPHPTRSATPPGSHHQHYQQQRRSYQDIGSSTGPELLLTPLREIITHRDDSPVRRVSLHESSSPTPISRGEDAMIRAYSILISDVALVDSSSTSHQAGPSRGSSGSNRSLRSNPLNNPNRPPCQIFITTFSCGLLDFQCLNQNGYDILMAFLKASVAPERIVDGGRSRIGSNGVAVSGDDGAYDDDDAGKSRRSRRFHRSDAPSLRSSSSVTSCLDVDAFTAAHLQGRADRETWPEKMTRRVGKVVNSLSELSGALCDFAWCLEGDHVTRRDDHDDNAREQPPRQSPPSSFRSPLPKHATPSPRRHCKVGPNPSHQPRAHFRYSDLELDDQDSSIPTQASSSTDQYHKEHMDRRWNSLPHTRRVELCRKSSC